jgi:hypothetical protein
VNLYLYHLITHYLLSGKHRSHSDQHFIYLRTKQSYSFADCYHKKYLQNLEIKVPTGIRTQTYKTLKTAPYHLGNAAYQQVFLFYFPSFLFNM